MSTELLLLSDIDKLGKAGDVVKVADGYARNYLLPQDLAAPVSKHALRRLEKLRKEREEVSRIQLAEAKEKASKLDNASVTLRAKTVDGTRLYGSIQAADIAAALETGQKITVDKAQIALDEPIKETGTFDIAVKLHPELTCTIKVWVVEG
ncbi:MAG: 50S ribosomal protein L9 [Kiritimatiellia bacterium]|jgi:large subunit ribosomal protein L9|nr:50S ribosomal protein L9 [Kiritimatiellia bacterium]MDD4175014.1 50S ribosomal protein L9 [Kiritimatiellia bacterium]MDD4442911.1 50S ribosomal protein L9 [Kiritimatiellia bacterium]MDX9794243.1 50S ribosomal protein L9 [Kiritimatiellia bacterium]OQC27625.1 MAG: 50S ribosomal protein L9 [Verrucomicrobia bacterium ADurb.Bin070]